MAEQTVSEVVASFLENEKDCLKKYDPSGYSIILRNNDQRYFAIAQEIVPEYSQDILLLSRVQMIGSDEVYNEILQQNPACVELGADSKLPLYDLFIVAQRAEKRLLPLSPEQKKYYERAEVIAFTSALFA